MRVRATVEVLDTDIDVEVDDDADECEIIEAIQQAASEQVHIVNWEKEE